MEVACVFCSPPLVVSLCLLGGRIRVCFVGYVLRKLILVHCFNVSDVFFISLCYISTCLSDVRFVACVTLQLVYAAFVERPYTALYS